MPVVYIFVAIFARILTSQDTTPMSVIHRFITFFAGKCRLIPKDVRDSTVLLFSAFSAIILVKYNIMHKMLCINMLQIRSALFAKRALVFLAG